MKKLASVMMLLGLMIAAANSLSAQNTCSKDVDGKKVNFKVVNNTNKPLVVNFVDHKCKEGSSNQPTAPSLARWSPPLSPTQARHGERWICWCCALMESSRLI